MLDIPVAATGSSSKKPAYVSAGTQSITFSGSGFTTQTLTLTPLPNANCPISGGFYACSLSFSAPVGTSTLTVATYASTDGSGTPLSINTVPITIVQDQVNSVPMTLNGVVSTLLLTLSPATVTAGTSTAITASLGGKDAAGDLIVGPGSFVDASGNTLTPSLQSSDTTDFAVGTRTGYSWPISYNGAAVAAPTITLTAGTLPNATQQITVNPAGTPTTPTATPSPSPSPTPTVAPTSAGNATPFPTPAATPNLTLSCNTSAQRCGVQRWHTKTLDDVDESKIGWTPNADTVTQLNNLPVPTGYNEYGPGGNDAGRFPPYEMQLFTVRALLITRKHETGSSGDDDYHIEIADPDNPSATMVTEAPHGECTYACASGFGGFFDNIRNTLDACFGPASSSFQAFPAGVIVNFTGVGYFDGLHGQTGAKANPGSPASNFELHPLLSMDFVSGKPVGVTGC